MKRSYLEFNGITYMYLIVSASSLVVVLSRSACPCKVGEERGLAYHDHIHASIHILPTRLSKQARRLGCINIASRRELPTNT